MSDEPTGELSVEREKGNVVIRIESEDGDSTHYLPPTYAAQVAMWINQAAADAQRWEQSDTDDVYGSDP